jgi:DNA (cytosine-5)-methyltransferase 1
MARQAQSIALSRASPKLKKINHTELQMQISNYRAIPVIDLFAGPGGLGEGFSAVVDANDNNVFDIRVSIEKDPIAHRTLRLRAIFRHLKKSGVPDCYYEYIRSKISWNKFIENPLVAEAVRIADMEAYCLELGKGTTKEVDRLIESALDGAKDWVLIGGPPCQAYSLAGRSRRKNVDPNFASDPKHVLYEEYLRIIKEFKPSVFVMENVKGMLSSEHNGGLIFDKIMQDLRGPLLDLQYEIRSFVCDNDHSKLRPKDFTIYAEKFGVPQMRHRVILFGIRKDKAAIRHNVIIPKEPVTLGNVLAGLPPIRSRLSKEQDSHGAWLDAISQIETCLNDLPLPLLEKLKPILTKYADKARLYTSSGEAFREIQLRFSAYLPSDLVHWLHDPKLGGVIQHVARSHMRSDIHRYFFAACYAKVEKVSPKLDKFPIKLLPNHKNAQDDNPPFGDRFKVQLYNSPSTTVVSHISKDGHYYIHPNPAQCRALTVREAARLQTFPDNYFFEGNRTQQYHQVGNAVPPYLAKQIGESVAAFLSVSAGQA